MYTWHYRVKDEEKKNHDELYKLIAAGGSKEGILCSRAHRTPRWAPLFNLSLSLSPRRFAYQHTRHSSQAIPNRTIFSLLTRSDKNYFFFLRGVKTFKSPQKSSEP